MKFTKTVLLSFVMLIACTRSGIMAQQENAAESPDKLVVVWTSDDPYVAERVALMYTHAAKTEGWFKEVTLNIWGPSAKLSAENSKVQEKLKSMQNENTTTHNE